MALALRSRLPPDRAPLLPRWVEAVRFPGIYSVGLFSGALFIDSCIGFGSAFSDACWLFLLWECWLVGVGVLISFGDEGEWDAWTALLLWLLGHDGGCC
jgi:hypothetical protein